MKLLKWIFEPGCSHRFAWPRSERGGRHYQICLVCGTAYEYDWQKMRRTRREMAGEVQHGYAAAPAAQVWQKALYPGL